MNGYEKPTVTTLDSRDVVELLGPAQGAASGAVGTMPFADIDTSARGGGSGSRFGR